MPLPHDMLSRVLLSINDREEPEDGSSVNVGDVGPTARPGRTLITAHQHPSAAYHVLFVYTMDPGDVVIARILDPQAWQTSPEDREAIHIYAHDLLNDRDWWRNIIPHTDDGNDSDPAALRHIGDESYWVDCAQETDGHSTNTFTILNAWALAMGLELNPAFRIDQHSDFYGRAQRIFDLALRDQLDWKLLLAFFRCMDYVRRPGAQNPQNDDAVAEDDAMPPRNRRFDLRVRGFDALLARQRAQDAEAPGVRDHAEIEHANNATTLQLGDGRPHQEVFVPDDQPEDFRNNVVIPVVRHGGWRLGSSLQQVRALANPINPPAVIPPAVNPPAGLVLSPITGKGISPKLPGDPLAFLNGFGQTKPADSTATGTETSSGLPPSGDPPIDQKTGASPPPAKPVKHSVADQNEIPEDFDPCEYLHTALAELGESTALAEIPVENGVAATQVFETIAPVVRALNELHPPGQGFTFCDLQEAQLSVLNGDFSDHDQFVLHLHPFEERTVLMLVQFADVVGTIHVLDTKPVESEPDVRERLVASVHNRLGKLFTGGTVTLPDSLTWIFTPEQFQPWQSSYLNILNAWCILLNLPLRPAEWEPTASFFEDAQRVIQAVFEGRAGWKLIWAFLRCRNYVNSDEPPAPQRRFVRTAPETGAEQHIARMNARPAPIPGQPLTTLYRHFEEGDGYAHDSAFS
jgi:hypothetical protein